MRNWIFLSCIIFSVLLRATILNHIRLFGVGPDFLMVCVVLASVFWEQKWALFFSLTAGILKDIYSGNPLGMNMVLFSIWSYIIFRLSKKVSIDDKFVLMIFAPLAVFLNCVLIRLIGLAAGKSVSFGIFFRITFIETLYSAPALWLIFVVLDHFKCLTPYKYKRRPQRQADQ